MLKSVVAIVFFGLVACPASGQALSKKVVTSDDYPLWHQIKPEGISDGANWVSYYLHYTSGGDTLFVKHTVNGAKHAFAGGSSGKFSTEKYFLYNRTGDAMGLVDLKRCTEIVIENTQSADFSASGKYIVARGRTEEGISKLVVMDLSGKVLVQIDSVAQMSLNNSRDRILYSRKSHLGESASILNLMTLTTREFVNVRRQNFAELTWSADDNSVAFYALSPDKDHSENKLYHYRIEEDSLYQLNPSLLRNFLIGMAIDRDRFRSLRISADGQKVFFGMRNATRVAYDHGDDDVEVWNGNARQLYPSFHYQSKQGYTNNLGVWWPKQQIVKQVTTSRDAYVMLCGKEEFALTGNPDKYKPQYKYEDNMDFYLTDLNTGQSRKLLENQSGAISELCSSPDGMHIIYYRDANWWAYSLADDIHRNLTLGTNVGWDRSEYDPANIFHVYGIAGWTDKNEVVLYDAYDVWLVPAGGEGGKRITKGRENHLRYRIVPDKRWMLNNNLSGKYLPKIHFHNDMLFEVYNNTTCESGYANYSVNKGLSKPYFNNSAIGSFIKSGKPGTFAYLEQKYDIPPKIMLHRGRSRLSTIVKSNDHHKRFEWGRSKIVHYESGAGAALRGALFYPVNYNPTQKYPMVVYIYEKLSQEVHQYVNPGLNNVHGFNVSNLTSQGYMVLMPDIQYGIGNTGKAALDCITRAVQTVTASENIDTGRIGLMGHSFGGYETNFIVTQSKLFAAAISGAGVSDIISSYLTKRNSSPQSEIWRFENQQYRMGRSLYDDIDGYVANSPIMHAANITTPILLYAGKKDNNVMHEQSMGFYNALRRLQKKVIMLLYPTEGHIILEPKNQADLTYRVEKWFACFLKGIPCAEWIAEGTK